MKYKGREAKLFTAKHGRISRRAMIAACDAGWRVVEATEEDASRVRFTSYALPSIRKVQPTLEATTAWAKNFVSEIVPAKGQA